MILIVAEHTAGKLGKITAEMVTAAHALDAEIAILVLGANVAGVAAEASKLAAQVLVADLPALAGYDPELWSAAVAQIAAEGEASAVLIAASRSGREYSPRVAVKLKAGLLEDVIAIERAGTTTTAERYAFLARVNERVATEAAVVVATVKPGSFAPAAALAAPGEQYDVELNLPAARVVVKEKITVSSSRVGLGDADIVVSGGRGVGSPEGFTSYVEALADQLGAAVGATRAVVDAGWRPYAEQVGQTGKTVQPKTYIAVGISGAVQHLSGMNKAKYIVAINRDAESPIFKIADCGIVGNVADVVPALLAELRKPA